MYWTDSYGLINLNITLADARSCSHSGQCDEDVAYLRTKPAFRRQIARLDPKRVADCLSEYGAWEPEELQDHDVNLSRLLWIACCDISEEHTK